MNVLNTDQWTKLLPKIQAACPRLTPQDLIDTEQRIDLLTAKIQNRHWISRVDAQRLVLKLIA